MAAGLDAVIGNHLETRALVMLGGDFIDLALAAQASSATTDSLVQSTFTSQTSSSC
jgi:hypothetical protein